jgi:sterol O-acyltransferase
MAYGDWWGLLGSDLFLIIWAFVAVPVQTLIVKGIIPLKGHKSWLIRHVTALSPILIGVKICLMKSWPNFQIATFLAHAMVLFMKIHSYLAHNAELHKVGVSKKRTLKISDYPENVNFSDFAYFLLCPTLIYKTVYPKTPKIRWSFMFDRTIGIIVIVTMIYINVDMYMYPVIRQIKALSFFDAFTKLLLPMALTTILMFFLVFEYILNWFAEITRFADRYFYSDWWNSIDYAEFARKWNHPVHKFLQHHVYYACISKHGWSKTAAAFWTFLFSSILHELVISMAVKNLRYEFFVSQMLQIPLIWVSSKFQVSRFPLAGNIFFWASIFSGMTILFIQYAKSAL